MNSYRFPQDRPWFVIRPRRFLGCMLAYGSAFSLWGWRGVLLIMGIDLMLPPE